MGLSGEELAHLLNDGSSDANFSDKFVGDDAVRQISEALARNNSKTRVFLDRNCVGVDGAAALGDMLKVVNHCQNTVGGISHTVWLLDSVERTGVITRSTCAIDEWIFEPTRKIRIASYHIAYGTGTGEVLLL